MKVATLTATGLAVLAASAGAAQARPLVQTPGCLSDQVYAAQVWSAISKIGGTFTPQLIDANRTASIRQAKAFVKAGAATWLAQEQALWPTAFRGPVTCDSPTDLAGRSVMGALGLQAKYMTLLAKYPTGIKGEPAAPSQKSGGLASPWFQWQRILAAAAQVDKDGEAAIIGIRSYLDPATQALALSRETALIDDDVWLLFANGQHVKAGAPLPAPPVK